MNGRVKELAKAVSLATLHARKRERGGLDRGRQSLLRNRIGRQDPAAGSLLDRLVGCHEIRALPVDDLGRISGGFGDALAERRITNLESQGREPHVPTSLHRRASEQWVAREERRSS